MRRRRPKWLTSTNQLGCVIASNFTWDEPTPDEYDSSTNDAIVAAERFGVPVKYLLSRLHDGKILDLQIRPDRLRMVVSDENFESLVDGVWWLEGKTSPYPRMPVVYDFEQCSTVATYYEEAYGQLIPASPERVARTADTFLYAGVAPGNRDNLLWTCVLWEWYRSRKRPSGYQIVVVETKNVRIEEHHRQVWLELFGRDKEWIYDAYLAVHETESLVAPDSIHFLDSIGLTRSIIL